MWQPQMLQPLVFLGGWLEQQDVFCGFDYTYLVSNEDIQLAYLFLKGDDLLNLLFQQYLNL